MKSKFFTVQKRILILVICFFCLFTLCGCGSINYSIIISDKGTITLQFDLEFDVQQLSSGLSVANKNLGDFASKIQYYGNVVYNNSCVEFEETLNQVAENGVVKTYSGDMTVAEVMAEVYSNMEWSNDLQNWTQKNNKFYYSIALKFKTYNAYRYFNGVYPSTEDEEDEDVKEERKDNFFFAEDYTYTKSIYNDLTNNSLAQYFLQYFNDNFSLNDMNYSFTYSTPSTKVYSNASEIKTDSETGNIVHKWNFSADDLQTDDFRICTYEVKIRAWVWYALAVVVSILTGVTLYVIVAVKENKQKKLAVANLQNFERTSQEIREANAVEQDKDDSINQTDDSQN